MTIYSLFKRPYYDSVKKCYYDVIMIDSIPVTGELNSYLQKVNFKNTINESTCNHKRIDYCGYIFKSVKYEGEFMDINELSSLLNLLYENGFEVKEELTKLFQRSSVKTKYPLICFISK